VSGHNNVSDYVCLGMRPRNPRSPLEGVGLRDKCCFSSSKKVALGVYRCAWPFNTQCD